MYPLCFGFPHHVGHHAALNRVPYAIQLVLLVIYQYFIHSSVYKVSAPPERLLPSGELVGKVSGLREKGCNN